MLRLLFICAKTFKRSSAKGTIPTFGSMVVNGKFAAAAPAPVKALNKVDFPTLGNPTIPISIVPYSASRKVESQTNLVVENNQPTAGFFFLAIGAPSFP